MVFGNRSGWAAERKSVMGILIIGHRFPLTPALSRREREQAGPPLNDNCPSLSAPWRTTILPLPQGEGQGEGEVRGLKLRPYKT